MNTRVYGIFILIALGLLDEVSGLKCFNCSSLDYSVCGDPFKGDSSFLVTCLRACKKRVKNNIGRQHALEKQWVRGCAESEPVMPVNTGTNCEKQTVPFEGEVVQCHCDTTGCNSTSMNTFQYQLLYIVIFNIINVYLL